MRFTMTGKYQLSPKEHPDEWHEMSCTWNDGELEGDGSFLIRLRALQLMGTRIGTHPSTMINHLASPYSIQEIARMVFRDLEITGDQLPEIPPEDPGRYWRDGGSDGAP